MDRLGAAEAVLNAARARSTRVVCPGYAPSPMDADITTTVPRHVIAACEIVSALPDPTVPAAAGRTSTAADTELLDTELLRIARGPRPAPGSSRTA